MYVRIKYVKSKGLQQHLLARGNINTMGDDLKASKIIESLNLCGLEQDDTTALGS